MDPDATEQFAAVAPDELPAEPEPLAVLRQEDRRKTRRLRMVAAVGVVAAIVSAAYLFGQRNRADDATATAQQATAEKVDFAEQIRNECNAGRLTGPICPAAAAAAATPTPTPTPKDGRGIVSTAISDGHLLVTYTDGVVDDVGQVQGAPGRGIASTTITDGRLIVTFDGGAVRDLGQVVGPDGADGDDGTDGEPGRSIATVGQDDGRLIITYDDGTTTDAGPLPQGPKGDTGQPPAGWTVAEVDGSTTTCSRADPFDPASPHYRCTNDAPEPGGGQ